MLVEEYLKQLKKSEELILKLLEEGKIEKYTEIKIFVNDDGNCFLKDMFDLNEFTNISEMVDEGYDVDNFCYSKDEDELKRLDKRWLILKD